MKDNHTSTKGRKLGLKEVSIPMGIFDFTVNFVMGDYKKTLKYVAWKFDIEETDLSKFEQGYQARGKCFSRTGYCPIIWIPRKPKTPKEYTTLAHECIHAVFHLFEWASLPLNRDTEEVMTHAVAHIQSSILENL